MEDLELGEKKDFQDQLDEYLKENGGRTGASRKSFGDIEKAMKSMLKYIVLIIIII